MYKNKIVILLFALSFNLNACHSAHTMNKYDWIPTECAPENYPVIVHNGSFYYGKEGSIYIPDGKTVNWGWGVDGSTHDSGEQLKEAPHQLKIAWFSFVEKKNYQGTFDLDKARIDSLMATGFIDSKAMNGKGLYNYVKVGMAPEGVIIVWLSGAGNQVEVGRYQAKEVKNLDWKSVYPTMEISIEEYADLVIKDMPDSVRAEISNGKIPYGLWDKWRTRFVWRPALNGFANVKEVSFSYFNKEMEYVDVLHLGAISYDDKAAIEKISVFWLDQKLQEMHTRITFNEDEVFHAFAQIKSGEKGALLLSYDAEADRLVVKLQINEKIITLHKVKFQTFFR